MGKQTVDFKFVDHGSMFVVEPVTDEAKAFTGSMIDVPDCAWMGASFSCDHRMAHDLAHNLRNDGFEVAI